MDIDRLRLFVQGIVAIAVLGGCTFLGTQGVIDSEAISVLYGAALGAVGAGAVGGIRGSRADGGGSNGFERGYDRGSERGYDRALGDEGRR